MRVMWIGGEDVDVQMAKANQRALHAVRGRKALASRRGLLTRHHDRTWLFADTPLAGIHRSTREVG